jgi:hypothetical protein
VKIGLKGWKENHTSYLIVMMVRLESFETKNNMESWILRGVED